LSERQATLSGLLGNYGESTIPENDVAPFPGRIDIDRAVDPRNPVDRRGPWRRELLWGSADFERASALARRKAAEGYPAMIAEALRSHANRRALVAVFRAPFATVRLCSDEAARLCDFVAPAGRRIFFRRGAQFAQFVLEVPATQAEYLAGKSRQALRTNLRHAARAGIKCERVSCYDDWRLAAEAILRTRGLAAGRSLLEVIGPPDPRHRIALYVATDPYERPVAFAGTALFGDLAYLFTVLSARDHPAASPSLWALNAFVALDRGTDGIRYLTVGSALRDAAGTQYLAHLLGYRVRNLRFVCR
jgi:hypothetical protein